MTMISFFGLTAEAKRGQAPPMRIQKMAPTGQAQVFEVNETFFSTTDSQGVITAGNLVFSRTSGYDLKELVGQPHNLIRHRDVPRCVFRMLWETARASKVFSGYVKNQARNGNHYWVFALIVRIPSGYLSVRIKPTTPLLGVVEKLYQKLIDLESSALAGGASEQEASDASLKALGAELKQLGFQSYESFSHHALNAEIKSRDTEVRQRRLHLFPAVIDPSAPLLASFDQAIAAYKHLIVLFDALDAFQEIAAKIQHHNRQVGGIAEGFRVDAINVHVAAHPLGADGIAVGMVAQFLNGYAKALAGDVSRLSGHISNTAFLVSEISSNLSGARIQIEMFLHFISEVAGLGTPDESTDKIGMVGDLRYAFLNTIKAGLEAIAKLQQTIPEVQAANDVVHKDIIQLQVAQITGLTEVARLCEADNLNAMFTGLRQQIESAKCELENLSNIVDQLVVVVASTPSKVAAIHSSLGDLEDPRDALRKVAAAS